MDITSSMIYSTVSSNSTNITNYTSEVTASTASTRNPVIPNKVSKIPKNKRDVVRGCPYYCLVNKKTRKMRNCYDEITRPQQIKCLTCRYKWARCKKYDVMFRS
uniref:uncharacterized protein LOC120346015 n=1 Tax=Styela clava TaxID=7725 RepID=UPI00193A3E93|nr:uncharacterized protein LOC120346015 [Styela clava]